MKTSKNPNMETYQGIQTFTPTSTDEWRAWLEARHATDESVWVIFYKKDSGIPTITWSEAVDEALCFGWIDSTVIKGDEKSYLRFFSRRKPNSIWSKINKEKVAQLIKERRMMPAGLKLVEQAKQTGTWDTLNEVDQLIVPDDLQRAFDQTPAAFQYWERFPPSSKKLILWWIFSAKTAPTREKRISETIEKAAQNIRANHPGR